MPAIPIKNGTNVHFPEYGNKFARCDIYRIGNTYIFVGSPFYDSNFTEELIDATVRLAGNTIDRESQGYWLIIVPEDNCRFFNKSLMEHPNV